MQIVIDIPDGCYEELNNGQFPVQEAYRLVAWIKNGTPLPKGHDKLIDAHDLRMCIIARMINIKANNNISTEDLNDIINNEVKTILEADKGVENDN